MQGKSANAEQEFSKCWKSLEAFGTPLSAGNGLLQSYSYIEVLLFPLLHTAWLTS